MDLRPESKTDVLFIFLILLMLHLLIRALLSAFKSPEAWYLILLAYGILIGVWLIDTSISIYFPKMSGLHAHVISLIAGPLYFIAVFFITTLEAQYGSSSLSDMATAQLWYLGLLVPLPFFAIELKEKGWVK